MEKIPSFQKNHDELLPGLYMSVTDGIATFDLRFKKPNAGDYIAQPALHSIEHMLATALRNGSRKEDIVYFGPMGCRTGFYLLTKRLGYEDVLAALLDAVAVCLTMDGVPGSARRECGNYLEHDLAGAKAELQKYGELLKKLARKEEKRR